jgi:RNA 2',3'-cyclic 3'-phosphodiesterase
MTESANLVRAVASGFLRGFVAVPLPGAVQAEIAEAARDLAPELPGVKWSQKAENLHVTMKFLGPVAVDRLDALGAALADALADTPRFAFNVRGWGAFPSLRDAQVVFAGIEENEGARRLAAVAEIVETVAARFGLPREQRRFTGHVTVGRCKNGKDGKDGKDGKGGIDARAALVPGANRVFGLVSVDEVHVCESRLGRSKDVASTYVLRSRAPLGARGAN